MKTLTIPGAGLLLLLFLTGCTSVKRFRSAEYKGEDHGLVDMALFGARLDQPGSEPAGRNLWDLSAGAQTQLIQILNERYPDNSQFSGALNQEYLGDEATRLKADFTRQELRMVFTITKLKDFTSLGEAGSRYSPADRIESMKFSLEIPARYRLKFTSWNRYTTEYGEIEIADMSFSRSIDLSAEVSTEYGDGGLKSSSGRKEDQALKSRYMKLNGRISPLSIEMEAEGNREIDLAGNVVADVSLAFEGFPERITIPVYEPGREGFQPILSQLSFLDVRVPRLRDAPDTIVATLEMEYIYRHVESGWKTYQEWDDRVAFYRGKVRKQIPLFQKDQYLPRLYSLAVEEKGGALKIRSGDNDYPLQFINYQTANRFLEWLRGSKPGLSIPDREGQITAGDFVLVWGDQPLTYDMLSYMKTLKVIPVF